jgi:hypothetical protein
MVNYQQVNQNTTRIRDTVRVSVLKPGHIYRRFLILLFVYMKITRRVICVATIVVSSNTAHGVLNATLCYEVHQ